MHGREYETGPEGDGKEGDHDGEDESHRQKPSSPLAIIGSTSSPHMTPQITAKAFSISFKFVLPCS